MITTESTKSEVMVAAPVVAVSMPAGTPAVPVVVAGELPVEVPAVSKSDRRSGPRKTVNPDGSVSYGLKADGSPRKVPGRKPKSA